MQISARHGAKKQSFMAPKFNLDQSSFSFWRILCASAGHILFF